MNEELRYLIELADPECSTFHASDLDAREDVLYEILDYLDTRMVPTGITEYCRKLKHPCARLDDPNGRDEDAYEWVPTGRSWLFTTWLQIMHNG